jgi:hypothetical protein
MMLTLAIGVGLAVAAIQLPFAILREAERQARLARRRKK